MTRNYKDDKEGRQKGEEEKITEGTGKKRK